MALLPKALFISHGGGPLPLLGDPGHTQMVTCLQQLAAEMPKPKAVLIISAHWECELPTITASAKPRLIYDYHGFPPESYDIQYPCAGQPLLANKVYQLLEQAGIESRLDYNRGLDHGVFVPMKIMYPDADIPCVQLSLVSTLDEGQHIAIGEALIGLEQEQVLLIGSGFSFHNLRAFFSADSEQAQQDNHDFEQWLVDICTNKGLSEAARREQLENWNKAPGARFCHPRHEHLLPLHVCYGAAQSAAEQCYAVEILNKTSSMYLW